MDAIGLENSDQFFAVIDRHPCVKGVLWGHIHNEYEGERKGVRLMGSPATCFQFKLERAEISVDSRPPAYRYLVLAPQGDIETSVVSVSVPIS